MRVTRVLLMSVSLLMPHVVQAIVSMEDVHFSRANTGYSGGVDLSAAGEFGNTDKSEVSVGAKLVHQQPHEINFVVVNHDYGESSGQRNKNRSFIHARHIRPVTDIYAWEGFSQAANDEFTRLSLRLLLGGGVRFSVLNQPVSEGYLGLGGFYEHEKLDRKEGESIANRGKAWRGNFYYVVKKKLNEHVSLVSSSYYQPDTQRFDDFRLSQSILLVSSLSSNMVIKLSLKALYDSEPLFDVKDTDLSIKMGFGFDF